MAPNSNPSSGSRFSILRFPLRLATGWGPYPKKLGLLAILMLVLLRVSIGWHFYSEGSSKMRDRDFDSSRFLQAARGPFAGHFLGMVWDADGTMRLNAELTQKLWGQYRVAIAEHYGFDDAQKKQADAVLSRTLKQYQYVLDANAADLEEIGLGRGRLVDLEQQQERRDVTSLRGQKETIEREWKQKLTPILSDIDTAWDNLEKDLNHVASDEQQASNGYYRVSLPRNERIDTNMLDQIIPWFDFLIGVCLLLGLFTPVAALAAGCFLFSVFLSQYPPTTGPGSTYYHLCEAMACFVIASTGAGRFAGIDSIIHAALNRGGNNEPKG